MTPTLILIDGSSYFFRAFHALPPLTNRQGQPTGAIYGVASMVKRLIKTHEPTHIAVIFDAKGPTFRDDWYPAYKAHRPATPPELSSQFEPLQALLRAMGLPILTISGVEADDVIATLAVQATHLGFHTLISTGDKDMAQLVNHHVTLVNTMTHTTLDEPGVLAKFGVKPSQIVDYLTLVGDTSDNVPGVPKCGPKTAVKWLQTYETLDNIVQHAHAFSGKIGEYLRESLPHLPLSKRLITLKTDVPLLLTPQDLKPLPSDEDELHRLAEQFEFKQIFSITPPTTRPQPAPSVEMTITHRIIQSEDDFQALLSELQHSHQLCLHTEIDHPDPMLAKLVGIALSIDGQSPLYIPLMHDDPSPQLNPDLVLTALKPFLESPNMLKLGHDLKRSTLLLKRYAIHLYPLSYDTMLASYLLSSSGRHHDLESLAQKYLHHPMQSLPPILTKKNARHSLCIAQVAPYACEIVDIISKLQPILSPQLSEEESHLFHHIEMPLVDVLSNIEYHGVLIDTQRLHEHGIRLKARLLELEQAAFLLAGQDFNLNSPKQLQQILYDVLQLPIRAKTPKGQPSTAEAALQALALDYELPGIILTYRSLSKLVSTYIDALPKRVHLATGRVHTSYNQAVTATGRLSSSEPNLQNIPIRTEEGRLIRRAFIAPPHHLLLTADYSQIELRIMAHLSQDKALIAAFSAGLDIHTATASDVHGIALEDVTHDMRRKAKAINFGLIYGMSAFGLAKQLHIERSEAQRYIDRYFERYPGVRVYMDTTRALAHEQGYVETLLGRRLHLPEINARNLMQRQAAERAAINAPLQGSAADIIKKAMISIAQWQSETPEPKATMIMQVHDELVFEVAKTAIQDVTPIIRQFMEQTVILSVPLIVSMGQGLNWDEAH